MSSGRLEDFQAYRQALELFDMVVGDMDTHMGSRRVERLVSQQLASADSVCSNIEEGYGRERTREYRRLLIIARGSLRETQGRYLRMRHWMSGEIAEQRASSAGEINLMLSAAIRKPGERIK